MEAVFILVALIVEAPFKRRPLNNNTYRVTGIDAKEYSNKRKAGCFVLPAVRVNATDLVAPRDPYWRRLQFGGTKIDAYIFNRIFLYNETRLFLSLVKLKNCLELPFFVGFTLCLWG